MHCIILVQAIYGDISSALILKVKLKSLEISHKDRKEECMTN